MICGKKLHVTYNNNNNKGTYQNYSEPSTTVLAHKKAMPPTYKQHTNNGTYQTYSKPNIIVLAHKNPLNIQQGV
jgi:hypothetical protein